MCTVRNGAHAGWAVAQVEPDIVSDAYANEPRRDAALLVRTQTPFNAETPADVLQEHDVTPVPLHFKRHHLPVPTVQAS